MRHAAARSLAVAVVAACGASPPPPANAPDADADIAACLHHRVPADTDVFAGIGGAVIDTPQKPLGVHKTAGDDQIVPDPTSQAYLARSDIHRITAIVRLCFDESGAPYDVTPIQTSCIPRYDQDIVEALKGWRYAPHLVNDKPVRVCTAVALRYAQR